MSLASSTLAIVIHAPLDLRVEEVAVPLLSPTQVEVKMAAGGICGSDMHYYLHGGFGIVRLKEPMVLGHEIAGTIAAIGSGVTHARVGDRVAVNPSLACGVCTYCRMGLANQCLDMRFFGSAMRMPHVQGGFRQRVVVEECQCIALPDHLSLTDAAFAEPLAVCLHGVRRAGDMLGRKVLVTGCGPIGALAIASARLAGAAQIVATDVSDQALGIASKMGADRTLNVATDPDALAEFQANKGTFDVMLEASGNPHALRSGIEAVRPRGVVVMLGLGGETSLMINSVIAREIDLRGTFRFDEEYAQAVQALASGRIDTKPLLSEIVPFREANRAFELAADRTKAMKVQLAFD